VPFRIREFRPESDFPALCRISSAIQPENAATVEEARWEHEHRDRKCIRRRWSVEADGKVVACGGYDQNEWMYHPRRFDIELRVHPKYEGRGIGSALFDAVMAALADYDPLSLGASTREDRASALRFLQNRGFEELNREWESRLDVDGFDPAPFAGCLEVTVQGVGQRFPES
jgi:mycothiol synthase